MMRMLVVILAIVVVVLGYVLEMNWLYAVAGALLIGVAVSLISLLKYRFERKRIQREAREGSGRAPSKDPDDELKSLGIMEIRRKEGGPPRGTADEPLPASRQADRPNRREAPAASEAEEIARAEMEERAEAVKTSAPESEDEQAPARESASSGEISTLNARPEAQEETHNRRVLRPYLQALRAAVDAGVVCFLKQEELALQYKVEAVAGPTEEIAVHRGEAFATLTPLLTASMAQRTLTVQRVGEQALPAESLRYRHHPERVRQVMLAPVAYDRAPSNCFLLVDTTEPGAFNGSRPRDVVTEFARLLSMLLEHGHATVRRQPDTDARPRREIIAEEMEDARADDQPLALALVYLNRAESVADDGEAAVDRAERLLRDRLDREAADGRVVRFGELTFGIFYNGEPAEVEEWAGHLQQALAAEDGALAGGVSIGIALLHDRHGDAESFRTVATEALREAYETGTCTILE